ncbi:MAG: cyclic pyranopterin phosphate synthase, partial [Gammaproteobacteria bacterium]
ALQGIAVAHRVGIGPIKVNRVVKQGINDQDIVPMARHFKGSPLILCFIEYMDVGATNGWKLGEVIPSAEVVGRIWAETALEEIAPNYTGETSLRWRYQDGSGEIGIISSVTQTFCHSCTRVRFSTEGKLYTCLFTTGGHDLRTLIRGGCSDEEVSTAVAHIWRAWGDQNSKLRSAMTEGFLPAVEKIEMSCIGG